MFLSEWREFPSAPYLAGGKKNLMTARVSMLLKSRASLTCFRVCFLPGRAKDLSAQRVLQYMQQPSLWHRISLLFREECEGTHHKSYKGGRRTAPFIF